MTQEPKWTPGPWVAKKTYGHEQERIFWDIRPEGSLWEAVASAWCSRNPESRVNRNAMDANAHLIAAAPELYEALKGLLADIQDYQRTNNLGGENNHWQVQARAALAKARVEA